MTLTKYQTCKIMSNMTQNDKTLQKIRHRISSYSFRGKYSFSDLEIQRSQYINVRKLFKGGNYSRAETIWRNTVCTQHVWAWNLSWNELVIPHCGLLDARIRASDKNLPVHKHSWKIQAKLKYLDILEKLMPNGIN